MRKVLLLFALAWMVGVVRHAPAAAPDQEGPSGARGSGGSPAAWLSTEGNARAWNASDWLTQLDPLLGGTGPLDLVGPRPSRWLQVEVRNPPVSDGEFVWGPNVGPFDVVAFLETKGSPLAPYGQDVALWASYSSVNPKLLLAALEFRYGLVTALPSSATADEVRATIGDTAVTMARAFYEHLYRWGE
ncbi:MAG TPA: hypothetical protein VLD63_02505, partial [Anaerolineales bacterium]|nr:hypothetical protein [Anaerolineales bacterium]